MLAVVVTIITRNVKADESVKYLNLMLLVALVNTAAAKELVVVGDAYGLSDGVMQYREYHYYSDDKLDHQVVYKWVDETPLAEKNTKR